MGFMKNKINIIILIIWFIITIIGVMNHEVWRDEAQVWCLVRDLNFIDLYSSTRVEGHPMLWYLLLMPFAKLGVPVEIMNIVSFLFVGVAVAFLLWKSPFSFIEKILVTFSAGMVYFFPVIARNYALMPLAIFLMAYFYNQRAEKPYKYSLSLIFLSQTHILALGFCAIAFLLFTCEKIKEKRYYPSFAILGINFAFLFFSFYRATSENVVIQMYSENTMDIYRLLNNFCYNYFSPVFSSSMPLNYIIFYGLLSIFAFYLFKIDKKLFMIFSASFAYIFYIFAKVWFGGVSYQKAFVLMLILIFCYWAVKEVPKQLKIAFNVLFFISLILSVPAISKDIKQEFSGSKSLANYVRENLKQQDFIYVGYPHGISPLSAYLPKTRFFSKEEGKFLTYYDFNLVRNQMLVEPPENINYYICQQDFYLFEELGYELIFSTSEEIVGPIIQPEVYKIYKKKKAMT